MAGEYWSEADNALLVQHMSHNDCRGESVRFCCALHEGFADGITAKGKMSERDASAKAPHSDTAQSDACESCGALATVTAADGSKWCDECDTAAKNLGYDKPEPLRVVGD